MGDTAANPVSFKKREIRKRGQNEQFNKYDKEIRWIAESAAVYQTHTCYE
jgi:predicted aconitase